MNTAQDLSAYLPKADLQQLKAELARRRLHEFVKQAWPIINPAVEFVDSWAVEAICEHLEAVFAGDIKRLLINIMPRSGKSFVSAVCFPAWGWLHNPSFKWLVTSYSENFAMRDSVHCRRLVESGWYKRNWGDLFYLASDQNQKAQYQTSRMGERVAVGMMGGGTGRGGDLILADDPENILDANSDAALEANHAAWFEVWSQRVNDPKTARYVVIQQRISAKDLSATLLKDGGWTHLMLPNEYDPRRARETSIGWKDPRTKPGELLSPRRYGPEETAEKKRYARIYQSQFQQNPSDDESAIFKRDRWRFYPDDPKALANRLDFVVMSVDAAFKKEADSSMVAIHVWGKKGAYKYLLDRQTEHLDFNETVSAIRRMSAKWPQAKAKLVEDKANGPAIVAYLSHEIPGLIPWPPKGVKMDSKEGRAWACQPEQEAGNMWLPSKEMVPWVEDFIELCAQFPRADYDDDVDAMSQAMARFEKLQPFSLKDTGIGRERLVPDW